jgi:hypothetical protein
MRRLALAVALATVFAVQFGPAASAAGIATGDVKVLQVGLSDRRVHPGAVFTITIRSESKGPTSTLWDQNVSVPDWFNVIGVQCALGISSDGTFCEYGANPDPHLGEALTMIYTVQVLTESIVFGPTNVTACASSEEGAFIDANLSNNCKTKTITVVP